MAASSNARNATCWDVVGVAFGVLIVDDDRLFLEAARVLLEREGLRVIGGAATSAEALQRARELRPEVMLVDIMLGGESGFDLARRLGGQQEELRGFCLANYFSDPVFCSRLDKPPEEDPRAAVELWAKVFGNPLTWDDLPWLRSLTKLPLIVKGILHPGDARRAIDGGVDGIYCSNHGGRQANGGLPALNCLAEVVDASGDTPVLFDSGVRSGADLVKALAFGATAVGIGRPYAWGLALAGDDGVVHVLRTILAEADLIMAVDGYPTRADLTRDSLRMVF